MSNHQGITPEGRAAFGALVARTRTSPAVRDQVAQWLEQAGSIETVSQPTTQAQFARWITGKSRIFVSESAIGRLERGEGRGGPPFELLIALCKAVDILPLPDGSHCNLDRAAEILCGNLDPATGKWRSEAERASRHD